MPVTSSFRHWYAHARATLVLALPIILGQLSFALIEVINNSIAGHHGTVTLAAVSIGTSLLWLPMILPMGILIGMTALIATLHGAGRDRAIGALFRQALWLALGLALVLFTVLSIESDQLGSFAVAPDIVPGAVAFLKTVRWGTPAFMLFVCMRYLCDGVHWTLPTMLFGIGSLLVLVPLGSALAFGWFGLVERGAQGLGLASALVMWMQAVLMGLYLWRSQRFARFGLFTCLEWPSVRSMRELLRTGLPVGVSVLSEGAVFIVVALVIGRMGTVPSAAHQVAVNVVQVCYILPLSISEALAVRVGHVIGRRDFKQISTIAFTGFGIMLCLQFCSALVLFVGHRWIPRLYTDDGDVIALVARLLFCGAIFQFSDGFQVVSMAILRGMQDTRVPMCLAVVAYWGLGLPLSFYFGLGLGYGPVGMWVGLVLGLSSAAILLTWRLQQSYRKLQSRWLPSMKRRDGAHDVAI